MKAAPAQTAQCHPGAAVVTGAVVCAVSGKCGQISPVALPCLRERAQLLVVGAVQTGPDVISREIGVPQAAKLSWRHHISGAR